MIFAQFHRSFVSVLFILATHLLVLTPGLPIEQRLMWDQLILGANLLMLVAVLVAKSSLDQHPEGLPDAEYYDAWHTYSSLGFDLQRAGAGSFETRPLSSYKVEAFLAIVYVVGLYTASSLTTNYARLKKKKRDHFVLRFFDVGAADKLHQR